MAKLGVCIALLLVPAIAGAEILYRVTPSPGRDRFTVEMEFAVSTPTVELQMPSWSPGSYALENWWKTLHDVSATDEAGNALSVNQTRGDTWTISTAGRGRIRVQYDRPVSRAQFDSDQTASDQKALHYGLQSIYLYVVGRKEEPCLLELAVPANWKVAVGLKAAQSRGGHPTFQAKNYDELTDCPDTMGDYIEERYTQDGKEHVIAFRGLALDWIDRQETLRMCRFVTQIETDFFHGAPYDRYVWHFWVYEGSDKAGGTEHGSSAEMHLSTEQGPHALSGMAHEYFHLWNGKRIRSKELGPFDYTRLPQTGALWWLEGVTDYYSMLLPFRYGAWGRDRFLADAVAQVREVRRNSARFQVSPYESSYGISEKDSSGGYQVNYYPTGWVLGMLFDLELRARSGGKRSLDDVEHALWELCKDNQPGFEEGEIRRQLIRFGGQEMGVLYDQWVLKPGELPVERQLAKAGLEIVKQANDPNGEPSAIQERADITPAERTLLEGWLRSQVFQGMLPPFNPPERPPAVKVETALAAAYAGRYELANNVIFTITSDEGELLAALPDSDNAELVPVSADTFFYPKRDAQIAFTRDSYGNDHGEVDGFVWKQNGQERKVPRIGPFIRSLQPEPDPDTAVTERVQSILRALGQGIRSDVETPGLAPGATKDYRASGPVDMLAGEWSLNYIASQDVAGRQIERHNGNVSRILYYKLIKATRVSYLMVYLTTDGLVTDFDTVDN